MSTAQRFATLAAIGVIATTTSVNAISLSGRASEHIHIDYPGGPPPKDVIERIDDDDNSYLRPAAGTPCAAADGKALPYDTITLTNTGATTATVTARLGRMPDPRAACPDHEAELNLFLSVYEGSFEPAAPLANCLMAVDDTAGADDRCPTVAALPVPPGETRVFVVSLESADGWMEGDYALIFDSTLPVELLEFRID